MAAEQSKSTITIKDLNDYCLMYIFQLLPFPDRTRIERVNKRWKVVSKESWCLYPKRLEVGNDTNGFPNNQWSETKSPDELIETMRQIVRDRGCYLKEIFFTPESGDKLPQGTLKAIIPMCSRLVRLQAENLTVSPEDVNVIIENNRNIEVLGLGQGSFFTDEQLRLVIINNPRLRHLRIVGCDNFVGNCLESMQDNVLEKLEVRYCRNFRLTNKIAEKFSDSMMEFALYSNFATDHGVNSVVIFKKLKKVTLSLNIEQIRVLNDNVIQHARDIRSNMYLTSCGPIWALQFHR